MIQEYTEAVRYIEGIPRFTKKHPLEHTREFMERLGNPAYDRRVVHVAGTNGKGSVCAYIQAILESEGKRTGFFTSPHLISVNERIQIGRQPVSDEEFLRAFQETYGVAREMEEEGKGHPSYFEFLYGMGMKVFARSDVEFIILETGLGGRLDATNSFPGPELSVITSISCDHTEILGDTIEKIAAEKAGIIREGVPVFFDGGNEAASAVIKRIAGKKGASCREITNHAFKILEVNRKYIAFSRTSAYDKDIKWTVPICGLYQVMNAEIAIQAAGYLLEKEEIHRERWPDAVASVRWKGRMEEAGDHFIIDGAHNPGALEAFVESVKALPDEGEGLPVVLFSAVSDKKYEQMIAYLCGHFPAKAYVVTGIDDARGVPAHTLGRIFRSCTERKVIEKENVRDAVRAAYEERGGTGFIYCLGSLYLAGMIEKILEPERGGRR